MAKVFSIPQSLVHELDEQSQKTKCGIKMKYGKGQSKLDDRSVQIVPPSTMVTCTRCE